MNKKKLKIFATAACINPHRRAAIIFGVPPGTVSAEAGSVFTMTAAFNGVTVPNGVVIVNQTTGAVSVCNQQAFNAPNSATSNEACEFRGRAIPGSGTSSLDGDRGLWQCVYSQ